MDTTLHAIPHRRHLPVAAALLGMATMGLQILIYREQLAAFQGNEFTISIMLGAWLTWTGIGSIAGRRMSRFPPKISPRLLFAALAVTAPVTLLAFRVFRHLAGLSPGELSGIHLVIIANIILLAPFCLVSGMNFSLLAGEAITTPWGNRGPGIIYLTEAGGAAAAAIIHRLWLAGHVPALPQVIALAALMTIPPALSRHRSLRFAGIAGFLIAGSMLPLTAVLHVDARIDRFLFNPFQVRDRMESPYGWYHILQREHETTLIHNQTFLAASNAPRTREETVDIPLAIHPHPRDILLLGGGYGGIVAELLKFPVTSITRVEIDGAPDDLLRRSAPELMPGLDDPRVKTITADCRTTVDHLPAATMDIVISCLPEPASLALSRYYSREFFRQILRILRPGGIMAFRVTSSDSFLNTEHLDYLNTIYNTAGSTFGFDAILLIPGEPAGVILFRDPPPQLPTADSILTTLARRHIDAFYVSDGYLPFRMSPFRMTEFRRQFTPDPKAISTDLHPRVFTALIRLWSRQFSRTTSYFPRISHGGIILAAILTTLLLLAGILRRKSLPGTAGLNVFSLGFAQIILVIILVFLLQLTSGAAYRKAGLLLGAFSVGLACGAIIPLRTNASRRSLLIQAFAFLWGFIFLVGGLAGWFYFGLPASEWSLDGVSFLSGLLEGALFLRMSRLEPVFTGVLYGLDLMGSAAGAFLLVCLLFPNMAILSILIMLMAVLAVSSISLIRNN